MGVAVTCPYCQKHFPKSDTINSRHKAIVREKVQRFLASSV